MSNPLPPMDTYDGVLTLTEYCGPGGLRCIQLGDSVRLSEADARTLTTMIRAWAEMVSPGELADESWLHLGIAAIAPEGDEDEDEDRAGSHFDCCDCGEYGHGYMLRDEVWQKCLHQGEDPRDVVLCPWCAEKRLGRRIGTSDLKTDVRINWPLLYFARFSREYCVDAARAADREGTRE